MDELVMKINQLEKMIDDVSPLLVIDEWKEASEKLPQIFAGLTEFLQLLLGSPKCQEIVQVDTILPLFEHLVYAMNIGDSIQIADILIYDVHNLFRNITEQCSNA